METFSESVQLKCDLPSLWQEHKDALRRFIQKRVNDQDQVNDILSEVLEKVLNFCRTKTGVKNVQGWLYRITQNAINDYYRAKKPTATLDHISHVHEIQDQDAYQEAVLYVLPLINLLPTEYAEPLRMADIDNMRQTDIARQLNLSLPAVKSRVRRARHLLKAEIISCCRFETDSQGNLVWFEIKENCKTLQQVKAAAKN
jgi:RNA polymerase sigma-70 factor (ECF subfamily)